MGFVLVFAFIGYSDIYQVSVRAIDSNATSPEDGYAGKRIDYGINSVTKLAIYAELHPNQVKILEYRGQRAVFTILPFISKSTWPGKPLPYALYVTSAIFFAAPQLWGYGITTSILEEGISNFSWIGMVLAPLLILVLCIYDDRPGDLILSMSTVLVASLLLAVQIVSFYPIIVAYLIYLIYKNRYVSVGSLKMDYTNET
ncbi:hypothetical protein E7T09_08235 [Deinococcus sp. KSM4-11]|uniref:hypothetical protein n=1 Tax=Deinococcus sp. KSM4-11 TaxID=2568654 RepID=UPI0010A59A7A|nr:hypothetical protein [Deinococcus sp. KSM4-11]THF87142.1 hypothetical protein E7T09_08235 [Deinococcus sp. KSM4-11]